MPVKKHIGLESIESYLRLAQMPRKADGMKGRL